MKATRFLTFAFAVIASLMTFRFAMFRGGGPPGAFVSPYLFAASVLALVPSSFVWHRLLRNAVPSVGRLFFAAAALYFGFALVSGILVVAAESIAEQAAIRVGYHGDSGPHDFYPSDSGMSHWPTPWFAVLFFATLGSVIWLPATYLVTLFSAVCESKLRILNAEPCAAGTTPRAARGRRVFLLIVRHRLLVLCAAFVGIVAGFILYLLTPNVDYSYLHQRIDWNRKSDFILPHQSSLAEKLGRVLDKAAASAGLSTPNLEERFYNLLAPKVYYSYVLIDPCADSHAYPERHGHPLFLDGPLRAEKLNRDGSR